MLQFLEVLTCHCLHYQYRNLTPKYYKKSDKILHNKSPGYLYKIGVFLYKSYYRVLTLLSIFYFAFSTQIIPNLLFQTFLYLQRFPHNVFQPRLIPGNLLIGKAIFVQLIRQLLQKAFHLVLSIAAGRLLIQYRIFHRPHSWREAIPAKVFCSLCSSREFHQ